MEGNEAMGPVSYARSGRQALLINVIRCSETWTKIESEEEEEQEEEIVLLNFQSLVI